MRSIIHKLKFDEKPELRLTDEVSVRVNNTALAVLEANEALTAGNVSRGLNVLFSEDDKNKILGIRGLTFGDLMTVLQEAIQLCLGVDGEEKN